MPRAIWITAIIIVLVIAAGYIIQKPERLNKILNMVVEKPPVSVKNVEVKTAVFLIADPTGSTYQDYAIPKIDTTFIGNLSDVIYHNGGGYLWLSYIDRNSKNNKVVYANILSPLQRTQKPARFGGETYYEFDKRIKKYNVSMKYFVRDSLNNYNKYRSNKRQFLELCEELLNRIYVKHSPDNMWSDVIGSMNAAFYSLNTVPDGPVNKYLICFSDLQQDTPYLNPKPKLKSIPQDIKILVINPVPGSSKMVTNRVVDIDYPTRVFEYLNKKR